MSVFVAGRINYDTILFVKGFFQRGRKFVGNLVTEGVGGTGANIAISMARAGARNVKLFGAVGKDLENTVKTYLQSEGVGIEHVIVFDGETGRAYIIIDDEGESTIITIPGVNNMLSVSHIPKDILDSSAIVVANIPRDVATAIVEKFKGQLMFMDPGNSWNPLELVSKTQCECFILPNEYEFSQYLNNSKSDPHAYKNCVIVVKKGEKGATLYDYRRGRALDVGAMPLKKLGLKVYSTAGCGDIFTGVFATLYMESRNIEKAMLYASIAAGVKATRILSHDVPKRSELETLIDKYRSMISINEYSL